MSAKIVVFKERAAIMGQDKVRRGTFVEFSDDGDTIVSIGGQLYKVWPNDVIRVEDAQHGWEGFPLKGVMAC